MGGYAAALRCDEDMYRAYGSPVHGDASFNGLKSIVTKMIRGYASVERQEWPRIVYGTWKLQTCWKLDSDLLGIYRAEARIILQPWTSIHGKSEVMHGVS